MIDSSQVRRPSLSLLEGGRRRDLECLGPWLLYCSPVRTIVQRCIIRTHHLSPSGRCRVSALHKESPLHSKSLFFFFGWKEESTDFSFSFFFFTESPVLVCQIMHHKCVSRECFGCCCVSLKCERVWVSIWQQFTPSHSNGLYLKMILIWLTEYLILKLLYFANSFALNQDSASSSA